MKSASLMKISAWSGYPHRIVLGCFGIPVPVASFFLIVFASLFALNVEQVAAQPAVPHLSGRVVDLAAILSSATEQQVTELLEQHEQATSNQIAVLTIGSLEGAVLEEYSLEVARAWKLGQADRDNGVLLLIAFADRRMRIEVGYGLEGDLPDILAKRIIDQDIRPFFRNQDFDGGVLKGVQAIIGTIEGTYEPAEAAGTEFEEIPVLFRLFFSLMFLGIPSFSLYGTIFTRGCTRWFMLLFFTPFFLIGGAVLWPPYGGGVNRWYRNYWIFLVSMAHQ